MSSDQMTDAAAPVRGHETVPPPRPLLAARGISKRYGGIQALRAVDFELHAGEVHALVGENGAGKSTFVKAVAGLEAVDAGQFLLDGATYRPHRNAPEIAVVHQELAIVPDLTVLDNVLLGNRDVRAVYRRRRFRDRVRAALDRVGLRDVGLDERAGELSLAERQLVEIARAGLRDARIMILDEPTATLTDTEIERVFAAVRASAREGRAVIFISHRLRELFELCDRVTIFRNGRVVASRRLAELTRSELVREMLGQQLASERAATTARAAGLAGREIVLDVRGLTLPGAFEDVSFQVRRGEIVGLVGQLGSGADEVVRTLAGLRPGHAGDARLDDRALDLSTTSAARRTGVGYVSDDRAGDGVFLDMTCGETITSTALAEVAPKGVIKRATERELAATFGGRFRLDAGRLAQAVGSLSGGNQQKVALAKAAAGRPSVFALNEPTRGVDVGARAEISARLRESADAGVPVVLFTSDLTEALEVCDTIVTLFRGRVVRISPVRDADQGALLRDVLHPVEAVA